jgi:hypothetical protein
VNRTTYCGCARRGLALVLLWALGGCAVWAAGFGQPYIWHEAGRVHEVWVDPTLVAEVAHGGRGAAITASPPTAIPGLTPAASPWRGVRLWRLPAGQNALQALATLNAAASASFMPVFRDAPDSRAPMRLLGQELIVTFRSDWDRVRVVQWADNQSLTVVRKMPVGQQTYLLRASQSGVQLLGLVKRLDEAGTVQAVYPNWRRAVTVR